MRLCSVLLLLLVISPCAADQAGRFDWPQWQGPGRDAVSDQTGLLGEWPEGGPAVVWSVEDLGGGYSAASVADGGLFGMSNRDGQEIVWRLDESTGRQVWATPLGPAVTEGFDQGVEGPGCTPTYDQGRLYVVGAGGLVVCLDAADGREVWRRSMVDDFGGGVPRWRYNESPLIDGQKLVCTPGGEQAVMVALDKLTGEPIWKTAAAAPNGDAAESRVPPNLRPTSAASYASAIAIDYQGRRQYVQFTAPALIGVDAADGRLLWSYKAPANGFGINCSTPLFHNGLIFAASAYGTGGGAVRLAPADGGYDVQEVYFTSSMQNHHGGMIVVDDCLYGANGGNGGGFLSCLDFATGKVRWRDRDAPKGALAMADGLLYLYTEEGEVLLIEPNPDELIVRSRFKHPHRSESPAWTHPVIANGRLYIRDQNHLFCYDVAAE